MAVKDKNAGKQPIDSSHGKRKLPNIEPVRPNIIKRDTVIVLWVVEIGPDFRVFRFFFRGTFSATSIALARASRTFQSSTCH